MKNLFNHISISLRLWLFMVVVLLLIGTFQFYAAYLNRQQAHEDFSRKAGNLTAQTAIDLAPGIWLRQVTSTYRIMEGMEAKPDIAFLYLTDPQNLRLYGFRDDAYGQRIREALAASMPVLNSGENLVIRQEILFNSETVGYLVAGFSRQWLDQQIVAYERRLLLAFGALALLTLLLTAILSRRLSLPLVRARKLLETYRFSEDAFDIRLPEKGAREVSRLAGHFNELAAVVDDALKTAHEQQAYLEKLFRFSPAPIVITDARGLVERVNQSACDFFERDKTRLVGQKLENLIGGNNMSIIRNYLERTGKDLNGYATTLKTEGDEKKIVEINLAILRDSIDEIKNYIMTIADVTPISEIQHEILEGHSALAGVNQALSHKTLELEAARQFNSAHLDKLRQMIEISRQIISASTVVSVLDSLVGSGASLFNARECVVFLWEERQDHLTPVRTLIDAHFSSIAPVAENEGGVWRTFSGNAPLFFDSLSADDIALAGSLNGHQLCLTTAPISGRDNQYGVVAMLQRPEDNAHPADMHLLHGLAQQAAVSLEKIYLVRGFQEKNAEIDQQNIENRKTQRQEFQVQKMESLGALVGGVAHRFNNLLGIIQPNLDLLLINIGDTHETERRVGIIRDAVQRATELTGQMMRFSPHQIRDIQRVSPNQLIVDVITELESVIEPHIRIDSQLDISVTDTGGDPQRLRDALRFLLQNAIEAMPGGGVITVSSSMDQYSADASDTAGTEREYIRITVHDEGSGISDRDLYKIFDPFYTTKSMEDGQGLGLSATYGIVKSHNGHIMVETAPQKGTTISLFLEPYDETAVPASPPRPAAAPAQEVPRNILVVDDEAMVRESLGDLLRFLGYNVFVASSGAEALQMVESNAHIDAAIIDFAMPEMDGVETIRAIRKIAPGIKIVLSTGYAEREKVEAERANIEGFLPKPYELDNLSRIVKKVLNGSSVQ